jgi:hypothetical protein
MVAIESSFRLGNFRITYVISAHMISGSRNHELRRNYFYFIFLRQCYSIKRFPKRERNAGARRREQKDRDREGSSACASGIMKVRDLDLR